MEPQAERGYVNWNFDSWQCKWLQGVWARSGFAATLPSRSRNSLAADILIVMRSRIGCPSGKQLAPQCTDFHLCGRDLARIKLRSTLADRGFEFLT
jgi:hypothetical protein